MDLLTQTLALTDNTRLAEETGSHPEWYKEWYHFCIVTPEVQVVVNFSLFRDNRCQAPSGAYQARVTVLVHETGWNGDVAEVPAQTVRVNPGKIDLVFGQNRLVFKDGVFFITAALERQPITLDLAIRPVAYPLLRSRTPIGLGTIDWLVVPRLEANGTIVSGRQVYRLANAPAYHDHNWGHWQWGQDFAWNWGFGLPPGREGPWSVVFDSLSNRSRGKIQELKLCLWKGDQLARIFANHAIEFHPKGVLSRGAVPKFPRIMGLIAPQLTTDVPESMEIEAVFGADRLRCSIRAENVVQIVIPNETDLGETIINEVNTTMSAEGFVNGETVEMEGKGFFEFLA